MILRPTVRKNAKNSEDQGRRWLGTFNDMVTLLLTFLVLLLSLSKLDIAKMKKISRSFTDACGILEVEKTMDINVFTPFVVPLTLRGKPTVYEGRKIKISGRINKIDGINAKVIEEGVLITLGEKLLFKTGMAEIEEKDHFALKTLSSILQITGGQIGVEGHTDDVPIHNEKFLSNWELSTARAVNIVKYFIEGGGISPERLSAAGYADSKPLLPNTGESNRALNRRVEIVLTLEKKGS